MDISAKLTRSQEISTKVALLLQKRIKGAQERYNERVQKALKDVAAEMQERPVTPWEALTQWSNYAVDFAQRSVLFLDTIRERGNNFVEQSREGLKPVLHSIETILDARSFERPVNYALVSITPPEGVTVDAKRRICFSRLVYLRGVLFLCLLSCSQVPSSAAFLSRDRWHRWHPAIVPPHFRR